VGGGVGGLITVARIIHTLKLLIILSGLGPDMCNFGRPEVQCKETVDVYNKTNFPWS
jgi:hypothetical protein